MGALYVRPMSRRHHVVAAAFLASVSLCGCQGSSTHRITTSNTTVQRRSPTSLASKTEPNSTRVAHATTQRAEPSLPVALQEGGAAVAGADLYVVAGYDVNQRSTSYTFVFDGAAWHAGPPLPVALNHPGVASIGNDVYVAGGFTPGGASARAFVLRAGASRWTEIAPLRRARGALALLSLQGRLYAVGGRDGGVEIAVPERYDPATNAWTDLPPMPDPRNHAAGYVKAASACIAGGRTPATSAAIDCFDTRTSSWTRSGRLSIATSGASAQFFGGRLIVAGGEPSGETDVIGLVQELRAGAWKTYDMLIPRHGTAYALYRGRLWQCGGASAPGFHAVSRCTSTG
jgi:N-acetylneuraminic acid mutarotase